MKEFSEEKSMEIDVKKELSQKLSFIRQKYEDEYKMLSRLLNIMMFQLCSAGAYGIFYAVMIWIFAKANLFHNTILLIWLVVFSVILIVLIITPLKMISIAKVFSNKTAELKREADAETDVYNFLVQSLTEDYSVFPNLSFGYGDIDIIVVGPTGIFVIDVKSNRGVATLNSSDKLNVLVGDKPHKNYRRQVIQETMQLKSHLDGKITFSAFIHSAIAMPNASVMKGIVLENPPYDKFKIPVLSKQGLLEFIHNQEKISGDKVKEVVKVIENYYKDLTEEGFNTNND
ncbi:MAG: nuclease-related domain-containing protein [Caldiserica bacterium]|nr:nuclease-related domain-containing protein [Caldisericota bacterium]